MDFEWDEDKSQSNLKKHGINFDQASLLFEGDYAVSVSPYEYEFRLIATGELEGKVFSAIYILRRGKIRIISARTAKKREIRHWRTSQVKK